jgi:hypothetical protein
MIKMFEAVANEFPFVGELPRREKRQTANLWERFREFSRLAESKGALVPPYVAAGLLGVSQQRVSQLMKAGRLERIEFEGQPFVTENSIVDFARSERKNGRPFKVPTSPGECLGAARRVVKDSRK